MIPLKLDKLHQYLNQKGYEALLQNETNQIYLIFKINNIEYPLFIRIYEGGELLQLLAFVPGHIQTGAQADLARLLHLLNKELDTPGFGMDENAGISFYRNMLSSIDKTIHPQLLESHLNSIQLILKTFGPIVLTVASGKATFDDILQKITDQTTKAKT